MSPRRTARVAGVFYLLTILFGVFGMAAHQFLVVSGDAARTTANILANDALYRSSIAAGIVATSCYLAVTILLYELLRPANKTIALLATSFSVIGCALGAVRAAFAFAPTVVPRSAGGGAYSTDQLQALTLTFVSFGDQTEQLGLVFFGVFCALIGYLIFVSTFLPRVVGGLMALAGVGWLTFLWPPLASAVFPFNVALGGLGELTLTIWLLFAGVNVQRWQERETAETVQRVV
jgi:hypothetical protein